MGVAISDLETKVYPWTQAPVVAIKINVGRSRDMLFSVAGTLWRLITLQPVGAEVAGPIGIYTITGQAVQLGWIYVMQFVAILSLNLGLINILPFPALDGGRAVFIFLEGVLRRKVVRLEVEAIMHTVGFVLLIALMAAITYRETVRYIIK